MLEFEDLDQVVLVGHSCGGMVITGVADQAPQRLAQLVYLEAEVPADGQCEFDLLAPPERTGYQQAAATKGQGWQIPPPVPDPLPQDLDARLRWAMSRMVPQPIITFTQPLRLANPAGAGVAQTYVLLHTGKGRPGTPRLCPAGPIGSGVAVRGARSRPRSPRDCTPSNSPIWDQEFRRVLGERPTCRCTRTPSETVLPVGDYRVTGARR